MLEDWTRFGPAYSPGLNDRCATNCRVAPRSRLPDLSPRQVARRRPKPRGKELPLARGYDRYYSTGGGGNYFAPKPLFLDRQPVEPGPGLLPHRRPRRLRGPLPEDMRGARGPAVLLAPLLHGAALSPPRAAGGYCEIPWPLPRRVGRAPPAALRAGEGLGIVDPAWELSPRDLVAQPWAEAGEREEWDRRMAVYAAMIDWHLPECGRALRRDPPPGLGAEHAGALPLRQWRERRVPRLLAHRRAATGRVTGARDLRPRSRLEGRSLMPVLEGRRLKTHPVREREERPGRARGMEARRRFRGDCGLTTWRRTARRSTTAPQRCRPEFKELAALWQHWADRVASSPGNASLERATGQPGATGRNRRPPIEMVE